MSFQAAHDMVRAAAERFPARTAVETPEGHLTHAELWNLAQRVAGGLTEAGARAGRPVAVLAEDRRELVAALLGTLTLGGLVVPVDLGAPRQRLRDILTDSGAGHVVVGAGTRERAAELLRTDLPDVTAVVVDAGDRTPAAPVIPHPAGPDDPSYIFYTSGSTGRPKGIVGRLGSLDPYIRWETELLGVDEEWRVSQLASPAFDAMLRDVLVPLAAGGTVCVPPDTARLDGAALLRWIDEERISLVHCVPSVFRGLAAAAAHDGRELAALRCVATSGEKLPPADAARWFDRFGDRIRLLNLYGPSETTMTKTFHFVTPADTREPSIPVGKPMPGTEILLLDERGRACPDGAVGEIHLRTPHRSLGYHNLPDATRAAFVPNPLGDDPSDIVYRTGDFGRLLPDGSLAYVGRKDHQVKIAGVRIELGDVENVLRAHPAVGDAAVVLADGHEGASYLCAFLELAAAVDNEELRAHAAEFLSDVMIPRLIVPLDEMPRTISGKIDRRALPTPAPPRDASAGRKVLARTPAEQAVAELWGRMLPVREIDVHEEFFDVGGHSLMVMTMLAEVQSHFGVEVGLQRFLAAPTIEGLAERIEEALLAHPGDTDPLDLDLADLDEPVLDTAGRPQGASSGRKEGV